ncbi:MAG: methionine biosynthesis protein MetW [Candidatus Zapsychrus exili]|nr:methionine biosynthesis protein MetW [Candidatus Zapsychrus exili]
MRTDYKIILDNIKKNSTVLDLGCGDGELLSVLIKEKGCSGTGIEINEDAIYKCVENGIAVSHGDIDTELLDYPDKSFDYVILNESLQEVLNPQKVILGALRVGKKVFVGIPNFCQIKGRFQVAIRGTVPVTKDLPHQWFDTPNLRFLSLKDFRKFCEINKIDILKVVGISGNNIAPVLYNLFADIGIFLLEKNNEE